MLDIWVNFYRKHDGKFLGGYTQHGTFKGELESTLALKAHDNNIEVTDIEVKIEREFEFEALSIDSDVVQKLMDGSSGVTINISKYRQLKRLEKLEDGYYMAKGTTQVVQKVGDRLDVTLYDKRNIFVDELNIQFFL